MHRISQSFLKDFSDYKSDFVDVCGLQIKAKYFEGVEFPSSEAMDLGNYFEYKCTGALPRNGKVPEPKISYKGTAREKLSAPFQRAEDSASYFKDIVKEYGIEIIDVGLSLKNEQMNGIVELTYANIIKECENLKKNTNCPNEQVVALLSVIASNFATTPEQNGN